MDRMEKRRSKEQGLVEELGYNRDLALDLDGLGPAADQRPTTPLGNKDVIAPWLNTSGQPAPSKMRLPITYKPSFSFGSTTTLGRAKASEGSIFRSRPSDASSIWTYNSDVQRSDQASITSSIPEPSTSTQDLGKKSSFLRAVIKRARSSSRLAPSRLDLSGSVDHPVPPLPSPDMFSFYQPSSSPPPTQTTRPGKAKGKKKASDVTPPMVEGEGTVYPLDKDITNMDGIIDLTIIPDTNPALYNNGGPSSPSSGFESSTQSSAFSSDVSSMYHYNIPSSSSSPPGVSSVFNNPNPFTPTGSSKRKLGTSYDGRKVSPKTLPTLLTGPPPAGQAGQVGQDSSWTAPESWAVDQGEEEVELPVYTESDDDTYMPRSPGAAQKRMSKRARRNTTGGSSKPTQRHTREDKPWRVRIYRANNTYHVAKINLNSTVHEMIPFLNDKVLVEKGREIHKLYLKERGRERLLAMTEKPASIVRRQLMQSGYDEADGLETQEDISFLLKFVYKSTVLGPSNEDLLLENYDLVDLTARALRHIPPILHQHGDEIICLNLSRNPMLEIPLDFIQSCTTLRELRLQNMAMKKVPQSVRHAMSLHRLDLSCNRITNLDDAGLDELPDLRYLKLQNNGMEKLPWWFPRLRALRELNISNNKFKQVPEVVCKTLSLESLDMSFNSISELPDEISHLRALKELNIVGNSVARLPATFPSLVNLRSLDCRRNNISDLSPLSGLPRLETILADHNVIHYLDISFGPCFQNLDASHNDITLLTSPQTSPINMFAMVTLDISHAKLSSLDNVALSQLTSLCELRIDHNSIRTLPDSIGELSQLRLLSCSNNQLYALPEALGKLQKLEKLEAHNNSITQFPAEIWECASLCTINLTSNLINTVSEPVIHDEAMSILMNKSLSSSSSFLSSQYMERKASTASSVGARSPPLAYSLEKLYLGENRLSEEHLPPLMVLKELRVLNLSFNRIQLIPPAFLRTLPRLEELYLSGNELTALPNADLKSLYNLRVLYLNGNKLQSLPNELGMVKTLQVLDAGSNLLRYNINNWEFDWNWNFNTQLRYLNLSGNKRLEIKPDPKKTDGAQRLHSFSELSELKVLGLIDVTFKFAMNVPDETEDRRVRTSLSEVNNMAYGIADTLGSNLTMFDFVHEHFRSYRHEAILGMFGRASRAGSVPRISKYLQDNVALTLANEVNAIDWAKGECIKDAMRRTFLKLNKSLHDHLYSRDARRPSTVSTSVTTPNADFSTVRSGACGIVLYFVGKTLHVAHAGNALAVISRQGTAELLSRKHDPFDRQEANRIRSAEGWISTKGLVNDDLDVSRSFGYYYLLPIICANPDILSRNLDELDEFVIIGNRGLWDFVSYQTAVDIARSERDDPMIAAQKLRDFAISYGAEGTTMIMVISVADLFRKGDVRIRQQPGSLVDEDPYLAWRRVKKDDITNRDISRLEGEVPAPLGHIALVFTDIRNSTHLWEANRGMQTAISSHNTLLRRQLRLCGGYEVKTEGDAFVCAFPTTLAAVWWCLSVQVQLLQVAWPLEILECEDGKEIYDSEGRLVARGLSVRMGIHCGRPIPDPDPTTHRMDYFGPVVNRAARVSGSAAGGQIMCSADVIREINASVLCTESLTEHSSTQPTSAIDAIRRLGVAIFPVGEVKLKGLEAPESLSAIYPAGLAGRHGLENMQSESVSGSRVQFSVEQMQELAMLAIRLEALTTSRVFKPLPARKGSVAKPDEDERLDPNPVYLYGNTDILMPEISKASDAELTLLLDSLSMRIENALAALTLKQIVALNKRDRGDIATRRSGAGFDVRSLQQLLSFLPTN